VPKDMDSSISRSAVAVDKRGLRHCMKMEEAESVTIMEEFELNLLRKQTEELEKEREEYREE